MHTFTGVTQAKTHYRVRYYVITKHLDTKAVAPAPINAYLFSKNLDPLTMKELKVQ